ncbi:MAG: hypothetical protein IIY58_01810, partial [Aeriscardovia sp.]|nr:hypothetical protein [Aeriscardovia sp.]
KILALSSQIFWKPSAQGFARGSLTKECMSAAGITISIAHFLIVIRFLNVVAVLYKVTAIRTDDISPKTSPCGANKRSPA